jgi:hypothetical protein
MKKFTVVVTLCLLFVSVLSAEKNYSAQNWSTAKTHEGPKRIYSPVIKNNDRGIMINEGFEGTFPPAGWDTLSAPGGSAGGTTPIPWHRDGAYYYSGYYGAAYGWGYSLNGWMRILNLDFSNVNSATLSWWWESSYYWHVSPYDNGDLFVQVSTNSGATWDTLWTFGDETMVVGSGVPWPWDNWVWYQSTISLDAYAHQPNVWVGFHVVANDNADIGVDDVVIDTVGGAALAHDVGVHTIIEPVGTYSLNDVVTPQAQVRNYGLNSETFPVIFTMNRNSSLVYADTVMMTLASGAADTAVFGSYTFTQAGTHDIVSYTELAGDENLGNDTAYGTARVFQWIEDFETTNGGFVADPAAGAWEWGVPTSGPGAAHSGTQLWATVLAGTYSNSANWKLTSQIDYVATEDNPIISFYHWYDIEDYFDGGNVKYSTDNGTTWSLLQPLGGYDDVAYTGNSGIPGEECFTGYHAAWEAEEIIVPVSTGQSFDLRFHFGSDASVIYAGWYIDDLAGLGFVGIAEQPSGETRPVFGFTPMVNPIRNQAVISYTLTKPGMVSLKLYDRTGRLVETLVNNTQNAGDQTATWDARNVANGVYFLKLEAENQTAVQKLILIK